MPTKPMRHTCIRDDGGTPNRRCEACDEEKRAKPTKVPSPEGPVKPLCYAREPGHGGMGRVCDRVKGHDGPEHDEAYRQHTWALVDAWKDRDGKD